jgi:hypothetical protein
MVDIAKLRDYALSLSHPRGRHKARISLAAPDLTAVDADDLQAALLESARWSALLSGRGCADLGSSERMIDFQD